MGCYCAVVVRRDPSCNPRPLLGRLVAPLAVVPVVRKVPSRRCEPVGGVTLVPDVPVTQVPLAVPPLPLPAAKTSPAQSAATSANTTADVMIRDFMMLTLFVFFRCRQREVSTLPKLYSVKSQHITNRAIDYNKELFV